jgi:SnoaL-like polyketide cyclase
MAITRQGHADIGAMGHLTERQKGNVRMWRDVLDTMNAGHFDQRLDRYFHAEATYGNPNRPDLGSYASWKTSPEQLYKRFPPSHYRIIDALAKGDDEIWVHCHHVGALTGGRYMGVEPKGQEISVEWFSTIKFKEGLILRIFSIADVLGMLINVGVLDASKMPVDPYK